MQELWDEYNLSQLIEGAGSEPHPSTAYHVQYYGEYDWFSKHPQYTERC